MNDKAAPCPLDKVNRQFQAPRPNALWVSDFTYVAAWQGFAYVAFVIDAFAHRTSARACHERRKRASCSMRSNRRCMIASRFTVAASSIIRIAETKADSTCRRNTKELEIATTFHRRASDRCTRKKLCSPGRPPAWRRENRCRFWQAIARGRPSEVPAAEAGVSAPLGPRWFRSSGGMPPCHLAPKARQLTGRFLSFREREEIAILLAQGATLRSIARNLGRSPSTISREVRRNAATRSGNLDYWASSAQCHAERAARRSRPGKLARKRFEKKASDEEIKERIGCPILASRRRNPEAYVEYYTILARLWGRRYGISINANAKRA